MSAILKIRMPDGSVVEIPTIKGTDGYTPVKGTDYWTDEDKAEIKAEVEPFYVTLTVDAKGAPIADKTFKEIKTALDDNKNVYIKSTTEDVTILGAVSRHDDNSLWADWFDPLGYYGYRITIESDNAITIDEIGLIDTIIGNEGVADKPPTVKAVVDYINETFLGGAW